MGIPAWFTIMFQKQIGLLFLYDKYNSGFELIIFIPFMCIRINTYRDKHCKKDLLNFY